MVGKGLKAAQLNDALYSLIMDGIFTGVGSVLSFLPIIVTLFFFLSLMEDSGYIARVAFVMDKLLRKIGLSGKSIVPLLIGFGCTVPAVMATRTLTSERDRKMTILLTPFMSCTAKLPIYAFFVSVFFPGRGGLIMTGLYLFGIFLSAFFLGVRQNKSNTIKLLLYSLAEGTVYLLSLTLIGETATMQIYPLFIHLPLALFLTFYYHYTFLSSCVSIVSAYLCCQVSTWIGMFALSLSSERQRCRPDPR